MKILIPLDGSKFSEDILAPAKELASREGGNAEVILLQVLDPETTHATWIKKPPTTTEVSGIWSPTGSLYSRSDLGQGVAAETKDQSMDRKHDEGMDYLRHISAEYFDAQARTEVLFDKDVVEAIAKYVESEKIDLIAMATHGRTGLSRVLVGSVAGSLLKAGITPLYLVRPNNLLKV